MPTAFPHAKQMHQSYRAVNIQPSSQFTPCPPRLPPQLPGRPQFPHPAPNTFWLYSLHFCPPLTGRCFGCGNKLKPSGVIGQPPGDLVIVSFMPRQYRHEGEVHTKKVTYTSIVRQDVSSSGSQRSTHGCIAPFQMQLRDC